MQSENNGGISEVIKNTLDQNDQQDDQNQTNADENETAKEEKVLEEKPVENESLKEHIEEVLTQGDDKTPQDEENANSEKVENNEQIDSSPKKESNEPVNNNDNPLNQTVSVDIDIDANNEVKITSQQQEINNLAESTPMPEETENKTEEGEVNQNDSPKKESSSNTALISPVRSQATLFSPKKPKNSQTAKVMNKKQFIALMRGTSTEKRRPRSVMKTRNYSSTVSSTKIPGLADEAIAGKNLHMSDALAVTDIIDELISRRVKALDENNYLEAHKIDEAMIKLRANYRTYDRESMYNQAVRQLADKKAAAEEDYAETKRNWKEKWEQFEQKRQQEMDELYQRHVREHEQFEEYWHDPANYSEYTKRTANQLDHLAVERALAITGRFLEAEQFKKMNEKSEKGYKVEQGQKLQARFEEERAKLIRAQEEDVEQLKYQKEREKSILEERERKEMEVKKLAIENATRKYEDEKEFSNFCAHTYKRPPSTIVPQTVSTRGGNDLPPMPPGRIFPRGVEDKVNWTKRPQTSALSLPSLRFKKYKVPKYNEKPKVEDDDI